MAIGTGTLRGQLACGLSATLFAGCQLLGYELQTRIDEVEVDGAVPDGDGAVDEDLDASARDATLDGRRSDGSAPAAEASADGARDATPLAPDTGSWCETRNDCSGCVLLPARPGEKCGTCGLGEYACDGVDAVSCVGGDATPKALGTALMIDDFEDGNEWPLPESGTDGYWFSYTDGTGTLDPPDGSRITPTDIAGAAGTTHSLRLRGNGSTVSGSGVILRLNEAECLFDVSTQTGIGFWIKGNATSKLFFGAATPKTTDPAYCGAKCGDFHGGSFTVTTGWRYYSVTWDKAVQDGWGTPQPFYPSQVQYIQFAFPANTTFDLYLDQVSYL